MGPLEAIKTCLAKSFQFKGRASRSEFWWFACALFIITILALAPHATVLSSPTMHHGEMEIDPETGAVLGIAPDVIGQFRLFAVTWVPATVIIVAIFFGLMVAPIVRRANDVGAPLVRSLVLFLAGPITTLLTMFVLLMAITDQGPVSISGGASLWLRIVFGSEGLMIWTICPLLALIPLLRPSTTGSPDQVSNPNEVPQ